jgi:ornithine carbamoyltransferase
MLRAPQERLEDAMDLHGRSLLAVTDLTAEEFTYLVALARDLRSEKRFGFGYDEHRLAGRNIALTFEKTSTRTRAAFEVAAHDEGAHVS